MNPDHSQPPSVQQCAECSAALAHDQRYCVECGKRRGALPQTAAAAVTGILEQGGQTEASRGPAAAEPSTEPHALPLPGWLRTPRAAAAAILGMLGFGVIVGSTVGAGVASVLPHALVVVVEGHHSPPAAPVANSGGSGGGSGGGGGGSKTITTTTTTPATTTPQQTTTTTTTPAPTPSSSGLPAIKHVFLIVLADQGYTQTFGSHNKYFAKTLAKQGEMIPFYYGVTGGELANEIALLSGQGPTPQTATNCPVFTTFTATGTAKFRQDLGSGCVYPRQTETLASQLSGPKYGGWKAYVEGINDGPAGQPKACRHPADGAADPDQAPRAKDPYVTWLNPFVYFQGLTEGAGCKKDDVGLPGLAKDLKAAKTTPALSYIVPSPCDDGSDQPCEPGAPAGLKPAEKFLQTVVPEIKSSAAYKANGMIAITFDQAPQTGPHADTTACSNCDPQTFPNIPVAPATGTTTTTTTPTTPTTTPTTPTGTTTTPTTPTTPTGTTTAPTTTTTTSTTTTTPTTTTGTTTTTTTTTPGSTPAGPSPGGGQVGLLLISQYVKPGSTDVLDYFNHFSLLASIEHIFKLKDLGYARDTSLPSFQTSIFNANS